MSHDDQPTLDAIKRRYNFQNIAIAPWRNPRVAVSQWQHPAQSTLPAYRTYGSTVYDGSSYWRVPTSPTIAVVKFETVGVVAAPSVPPELAAFLVVDSPETVPGAAEPATEEEKGTPTEAAVAEKDSATTSNEEVAPPTIEAVDALPDYAKEAETANDGLGDEMEKSDSGAAPKPTIHLPQTAEALPEAPEPPESFITMPPVPGAFEPDEIMYIIDNDRFVPNGSIVSGHSRSSSEDKKVGFVAGVKDAAAERRKKISSKGGPGKKKGKKKSMRHLRETVDQRPPALVEEEHEVVNNSEPILEEEALTSVILIDVVEAIEEASISAHEVEKADTEEEEVSLLPNDAVVTDENHILDISEEPEVVDVVDEVARAETEAIKVVEVIPSELNVEVISINSTASEVDEKLSLQHFENEDEGPVVSEEESVEEASSETEAQGSPEVIADTGEAALQIAPTLENDDIIAQPVEEPAVSPLVEAATEGSSSLSATAEPSEKLPPPPPVVTSLPVKKSKHKKVQKPAGWIRPAKKRTESNASKDKPMLVSQKAVRRVEEIDKRTRRGSIVTRERQA